MRNTIVRDIKSPKNKTIYYRTIFQCELFKQTQSFLKISFKKFWENANVFQANVKLLGGNAKLLWPKYRFSSDLILFASPVLRSLKKFRNILREHKSFANKFKVSWGNAKLFPSHNVSITSFALASVSRERKRANAKFLRWEGKTFVTKIQVFLSFHFHHSSAFTWKVSKRFERL